MTEIACIVCKGKQVRGVIISQFHAFKGCQSHLRDLVVREGCGEIVVYLTLAEHIKKRAETLVV